jgi:hypothetical protein
MDPSAATTTSDRLSLGYGFDAFDLSARGQFLDRRLRGWRNRVERNRLFHRDQQTGSIMRSRHLPLTIVSTSYIVFPFSTSFDMPLICAPFVCSATVF